MMIKVGTLPIGIEVDGEIWREYALREQLVADEIEVMESEHGPRALKNDGFYSVCLMARRLQFPGMTREVTPEMIMAMTSTDFNHLLQSGKALSDERASFRDAAQAAPAAGAGSVKDGV